eukprot:TRINITY_DN74786_c0_g1_i1.p2 TRINITY_DN74786_c0_g1~~TRINITY_DN74786_c0_g1_i1.p2  ORF type:complete len:197 (-),score=46.58 TRINITY_DN74786_c0_g1_i1:106-696(-)
MDEFYVVDSEELADIVCPKITQQACLLCHRAEVSPRAARNACAIFAEALAGESRIDFPTVTDICERTTSDALELAALAALMANVLRESADGDLSRKLKAVTVAHELLYDEGARKALVAAPGLMESLRCLPAAASAIGGGADIGPAAEGVYVLSTEILRQLQLPTTHDVAKPPIQQERRSGWLSFFEDVLADIEIAA